MLRLDPTKIGFDWGNARACAEAAAEAYFNAPFFGEGAPPILICDARTDATFFIQDRGDCIVVGFKGSKQPIDFLQDAKFEMAAITLKEKVHHGFMEDWDSICPQVAGTLKQLAPNGFYIAGVYTFGCPRVGDAAFRGDYNCAGAGSKAGTRPVFILGHSLGGSLAILCAWQFAERGEENPAVKLGDITFDVVNQNDIVPRTPPLLCGYRRVGQKVFLFSPVGWGVNPSLWMLLLSDALGFWFAYRKKRDVLIREHFISAYQQRIQNL